MVPPKKYPQLVIINVYDPVYGASLSDEFYN